MNRLERLYITINDYMGRLINAFFVHGGKNEEDNINNDDLFYFIAIYNY